MNSKDQAVSCPLGRSLWARFSYTRFDLTIQILKIYTKATMSQYSKNNNLKGIAYHNLV